MLAMGKIVVFRVEDEARRGPYRNAQWGDPYYATQTELSRAHGNLMHPTPNLDGEPWDESAGEIPDFILDTHVCGFALFGQFASWFEPRWRKTLKGCGFKLNVYEVDEEHVFMGNLQITFKQSEAKLVAEMELC